MANERGRQRERMSAWEGISEGGKGRWRGRRRLKCSKNVLFNVHRFQFEHHRHGRCKLNCWVFFFFVFLSIVDISNIFFRGQFSLDVTSRKSTEDCFVGCSPLYVASAAPSVEICQVRETHSIRGKSGFFFFFFASQPSGDVNSPQASWPVGRVIVRLWCLNVCQWCKPTEPDEAAEKNQKKKTLAS